MARYKIWIFVLVLIMSGSCSKDKEQFITWPDPGWSIESPEQFPTSFTAIVAIPDNLNVHATDDDKVAAFINDECRGVGALVKDESTGKRVYFLTIRGSYSESGVISLRYFNSRLSYLYEALQSIDFEPDGTYGSYDSPIVLELQNL